MAHDGPVTETAAGGADAAPESRGPEGAPAAGSGRAHSRMRQTVWDMVRSMAVVLAVVAVIFILAWRPTPDPIRVVDPAPVIAQAVAQAEFEVLAPAGLDEGWRPTSARWEPTAESGDDLVLHVGYVTPTEEYAQVVQSTDTSAPFLAEQTTDGVATGSQDIAGTAWERWESEKRRSLVRTDAGSAVVVSGTASWEDLVALAASLAPASELSPTTP